MKRHYNYNSRNRSAPSRPRRRLVQLVVLLVAVAAICGGFVVYAHTRTTLPVTNTAHTAANTPKGLAAQQSLPAQSTSNTTPTPSPTPAPTKCTGNTDPHFVLVSISARHMWACAAEQQVYESPVVTGMEKLAADLTPRGTYHVYAKQTNLYLRGSDSTGSWNDYVYYWMPFLNNQYGTYGFHDATWRADTAFGNINPNTSDASHGCVELPLATAKWLYNWGPIGTTVKVVD
ncbi:MAG TPA: L,D-transpeptidase [Candidatus Saccharimonadales bacterium]|nr:L,D-transpeptidase [Candidatus Saccharimonadales bacterium]